MDVRPTFKFSNEPEQTETQRLKGMITEMTLEIANLDLVAPDVRRFVVANFTEVSSESGPIWQSKESGFSDWDNLRAAVTKGGLAVKGNYWSPLERRPMMFIGVDQVICFWPQNNGMPLVEIGRHGGTMRDDLAYAKRFYVMEEAFDRAGETIDNISFWCRFEMPGGELSKVTDRSDCEWIRVVQIRGGFEPIDVGVCGDERNPAQSDVEDAVFAYLEAFQPQCLAQSEIDSGQVDTVRVLILRDDAKCEQEVVGVDAIPKGKVTPSQPNDIPRFDHGDRAEPSVITDQMAMELIHDHLVSSEDWSVDTLDAVMSILRQTGRPYYEVDEWSELKAQNQNASTPSIKF